ncbi:MAG: DNA methyltransferase [Candidatus Thorarchaeota archaeon]
MHYRYEANITDFIDMLIDRGIAFNGIITDSPYDALEEHRAIGTTTRLKKSWFPVLTIDEITQIMNLMLDLLKKGSHVYFWGNTVSIYDFKDMFKSLGYEYNNTLFWVKTGNLGMGYSYRNNCEPILFVSKGTRRSLRDKSTKNVFSYPSPYHRNSDMPPYAKPPIIYERILKTASEEEDLWLDPFAGTDPMSLTEGKTLTAKVDGKWKSWQIKTASVDIKYPDQAYPFTLSSLDTVRLDLGEVKL